MDEDFLIRLPPPSTVKWSGVSDPSDFSVPFVEMPSKVIAMEVIDGRLMVVLEDGRTIDMTDMFCSSNVGKRSL